MEDLGIFAVYRVAIDFLAKNRFDQHDHIWWHAGGLKIFYLLDFAHCILPIVPPNWRKKNRKNREARLFPNPGYVYGLCFVSDSFKSQ